MRQCSIGGCTRPHRAKGLCGLHYSREWSLAHPKHKERQREYHRKRYQDNPSEYNQRSRRYYSQHSGIIKQQTKKRREAHPERQREYRLLQQYGLNSEQYDKALTCQGHRCAICGVKQDEVRRRFSVDHDHTTKKNRGLLCDKCNMGIGCLGDSPDRLRRAAKYIIQWAVPH